MNIFAAFAATSAAMAVLLSIVLGALLRPLSQSLEELCGAKERGDFWVMLSAITLSAAAFFLALLGGGGHALPHHQIQGQSAIEIEVFFSKGIDMMRWAIGGVLIGLTGIAFVVLAFTAKLAKDHAKRTR